MHKIIFIFKKGLTNLTSSAKIVNCITLAFDKIFIYKRKINKYLCPQIRHKGKISNEWSGSIYA